MIDYKINSIKEDNTTTTINVSFFRGVIQKVSVPIILGDFLVDAYVRLQGPVARTFSVSNGGTPIPYQKITRFINRKLAQRAEQMSETVIVEESDVTDPGLTEL